MRKQNSNLKHIISIDLRFTFDVGIPNNELVIGDSPSKVTMTASVTTAKTTLGHSATVTARDIAYQVRLISLEWDAGYLKLV